MTNFTYVEIGYYEPAYKRVVTVRTSDSLTFSNGKVKFMAGGHGYEFETDLIRYIEPIHEEV